MCKTRMKQQSGIFCLFYFNHEVMKSKNKQIMKSKKRYVENVNNIYKSASSLFPECVSELPVSSGCCVQIVLGREYVKSVSYRRFQFLHQ